MTGSGKNVKYLSSSTSAPDTIDRISSRDLGPCTCMLGSSGAMYSIETSSPFVASAKYSARSFPFVQTHRWSAA